jgi:hypothetical protein
MDGWIGLDVAQHSPVERHDTIGRGEHVAVLGCEVSKHG